MLVCLCNHLLFFFFFLSFLFLAISRLFDSPSFLFSSVDCCFHVWRITSHRCDVNSVFFLRIYFAGILLWVKFIFVNVMQTSNHNKKNKHKVRAILTHKVPSKAVVLAPFKQFVVLGSPSRSVAVHCICRCRFRRSAFPPLNDTDQCSLKVPKRFRE